MISLTSYLPYFICLFFSFWRLWGVFSLFIITYQHWTIYSRDKKLLNFFCSKHAFLIFSFMSLRAILYSEFLNSYQTKLIARSQHFRLICRWSCPSLLFLSLKSHQLKQELSVHPVFSDIISALLHNEFVHSKFKRRKLKLKFPFRIIVSSMRSTLRIMSISDWHQNIALVNCRVAWWFCLFVFLVACKFVKTEWIMFTYLSFPSNYTGPRNVNGIQWKFSECNYLINTRLAFAWAEPCTKMRCWHSLKTSKEQRIQHRRQLSLLILEKHLCLTASSGCYFQLLHSISKYV